MKYHYSYRRFTYPMVGRRRRLGLPRKALRVWPRFGGITSVRAAKRGLRICEADKVCKIEGSFIFSVLEFYPFFKAILEGKIQVVDSKSISVLLDFYRDQSNVMYDQNTGMKFGKFFISTFVESSLYGFSG